MLKSPMIVATKLKKTERIKLMYNCKQKVSKMPSGEVYKKVKHSVYNLSRER